MRKLQSLILVLMCLLAQQMFAEPITNPATGKAYLIAHSSGYLLSLDGTAFKMMSPGASTMQKFEFVPVIGEEGVYNIKEVSSGQYIMSDGYYTPILGGDTADDLAKFKLLPAYDDYVKLQNVGMFAKNSQKSCLGTDDNNENSGVYADKSGTDGKHYWTLSEAPEGAITIALENAIKTAEELLDKAPVGDGIGQYPQIAFDALKAAITTAKGFLDSDDQSAVNAAVGTLNEAVSVFNASQKIIDVDPTKKYYFVHFPTNLLLNVENSEATIKSPSASDAQKFTLVEATGEKNIYNIRLADGSYITRNGWRVQTGSNPDVDGAKFIIELANSAKKLLRFKEYKTGNGYLGTDELTEGSGVYANKGDVEKSWWTLMEVRDGELITSTLEKAISEAEKLLADAVVGNLSGNYPQEVVDILQAAIAAAHEALNATEQTEINAAAKELNEAIGQFKNGQIVIKTDPEKQYYLIHYSSNLLLGVSGAGLSVQTPVASDAQKFRLIEVEGEKNVYNLQLSDGRYVTRNGWRIQIGNDPTSSEAKFTAELVSVQEGTVRFREYTGVNFLGTDNMTDGSEVYGNKGNVGNSWWIVKEAVEGELITFGLENIISKAEKIVAGAVVGEAIGNYPQKAVDALNVAIAAAKDVVKSATDQSEITAAIDALNGAVGKFLSSEIFVTDGGKVRVQGRKRNGFFNVAETAVTQVSNMTSGNVGEHFELVRNEDGSYLIKNGDLYMNTDFRMGSSNISWNVKYETSVDGVKYYNIFPAVDASTCIGDNRGEGWNLQTFAAGNDALQFHFVVVDLPHDPNRFALEAAIAKARNTLANIDRGSEIGQWSDKKCEDFETVIVKAETLTGATQEEVNAMTSELQKAENNFLANPNSVIKDELEALLVTAREKAAAAVVGIEVGQFFQTAIETFEAKITEYQNKANKVSEQSECDVLTEEFRTIVEAFAGHTGEQTVKAVLDDAIQSAEALYESLKDNVGTDKGQRPQEVVDAFKTAIEAVKAITEPVIGDLNTLQEARRAFINGALTVDRKALHTAIATADVDEFKELAAGTFDGQYPQEKIDAFNAALTAAKEADTDLSKTQAEVDACTKALNDALKALKDAKIVIVFTNLDAALVIAEPALASVTIIGEGEGQCPQSVIDALKTVIDGVKAIDRKAISQADVDTRTGELNAAVATFKTALVASTGLQALIDKAQAQLDASVEGFKPGNYPVTARSQYRKAIEAARAAIDVVEVSQADLLAAVEALKAAIAKFESAVIAPNDLTELNAAIAETDAFIAAHGDGFTALNVALAKAKAVVENPDNYAKSDVTKILQDLQKALKAAQTSVGIRDTRLTSLTMYDVDGTLFIEGLDGKCRISVYATGGKMVSSVETVENIYSVSALNAGTYVVTIQGDNITGSRVVVIK